MKKFTFAGGFSFDLEDYEFAAAGNRQTDGSVRYQIPDEIRCGNWMCFANDAASLDSFAKKRGFDYVKTIEVPGNSFVAEYRIYRDCEKYAKANGKKKCFFRFGEIPENERSRNFVTNQLESGVSVFEGWWDGDSEVEPNFTSNAIFAEYCFYLETNKPLFIVEGDVVGAGSDGEPVLRNVKILKSFNR